MLTEQQAREYETRQHDLDNITMKRAQAQEKMKQYKNAMQQLTDYQQRATPEDQEKINILLPELVKLYRSAALEDDSYMDAYGLALQKVEEYRNLEAQPAVQQTRRRTVTPNNTRWQDTFDWNERWNNEYKNEQVPVTEPIVTETPTPNTTSYKDDPLYPEFQEFLNRRKNKNLGKYTINNDGTATINGRGGAKITVSSPRDFYEIQNRLGRIGYAPNYNTGTIGTYRYNDDGTASFVGKGGATVTVSSPRDFFETAKLLGTN